MCIRDSGYRMLDDQRYMLERIVEIIKEKNPDALLIAGDIYDKSLPSAEAVSYTHLDVYKRQLSRSETFLILPFGFSIICSTAQRTDFASVLISSPL